MLEWLPRWFSGKKSACHYRRCRRCESNPWIRKVPWSRKWQPISVYLLGKSHRQRSLKGYSPWDHKQLDMTERLSTHIHAIISKLDPLPIISTGKKGWNLPLLQARLSWCFLPRWVVTHIALQSSSPEQCAFHPSWPVLLPSLPVHHVKSDHQ